MKILITGCQGLIGGEATEYFGTRGHTVVGIDNNQRKEFFGDAGDTLWNLHRVNHKIWEVTGKDFIRCGTDIRKQEDVNDVFRQHGPFDAVIHCAAQPSHDKSREIPLVDFYVNAVGTLNLLEATRQFSPEAVFIFTSTNKVYGDAPNEKLLVELPTRFDFAREEDKAGLDETCRIDQSTHSVFGASKVAADVMVQEYGRYYGLKTTVFRGGCLTGPGHSGVELHGFLSYLIKTVISGGTYNIYGYKGKQVRDNIHSLDVIRAMEEVIKNPGFGRVYNLGGGRENSISILEALEKIASLTGKTAKIEYVDTPRIGDHICYYTDLAKFKTDYPDWQITKSLDETIHDILKQLYWGKYSDHEDTKTYPLSEQSVVMDIGGFRGSWTASILEKYNPTVHLFEPIQTFYDACKFRFSGRPNVKLWRIGLSDSFGEVEVTRNEMHSSQFTGDRANVETIWLADICKYMDELGLQSVDLASLNCEGGEYKVLQRLIESGYIRRFKNIQIQFHDFYPNARKLRDEIRAKLSETHRERFNYPWTWESWERK